MNKDYLPDTLDGQLVHLSEEAAEVIVELAELIKHVSKAQRFGLKGDGHRCIAMEGTPSERINASMKKIYLELADLVRAMEVVEEKLR